jgi:hypothetical protein
MDDRAHHKPSFHSNPTLRHIAKEGNEVRLGGFRMLINHHTRLVFNDMFPGCAG